MEATAEHNSRIANLIFASVYPNYITKIEKKGRSKQELHQVIEWLRGFDLKKLFLPFQKKQHSKSFLTSRFYIPIQH